jgi:hypothetical protein
MIRLRSPERNKRVEQAPTSTWLLRSLESDAIERLHSWLYHSTVELFDYTMSVIILENMYNNWGFFISLSLGQFHNQIDDIVGSLR